MNYTIESTEHFDKELKHLSKNYKQIKKDLLLLVESLRDNPIQGSHLKRNCYKIRLAITSKNKGKSGGARVITNVLVLKERVILLDIYDKSDQEAISEKRLDQLINNIPDDLVE